MAAWHTNSFENVGYTVYKLYLFLIKSVHTVMSNFRMWTEHMYALLSIGIF